LDHITQFVELWILLSHIHLQDNIDDDIEWKLTTNGEYSAKSAYEIQFLGSILSNMNKSVWKAWAPPKVKFFAWLAIQDRLWTAERLEKRGWPNCGLCVMCKQAPESISHLLVGCRFAVRIWTLVKDWLGTFSIHPHRWAGLSISSWWNLMTGGSATNRKALASLTLLVSWEIWNERNSRVFKKKHSPSFVMLDKIKTEARLWVTAGAKNLGSLMSGE
jgi:hypothetical protein